MPGEMHEIPQPGQPSGADGLFGLGEADRVEIGSNVPVEIDDPETIWLVYEGKIDIFAVRVVAGQAAGARRHLFRVEAGDLLFGLDLSGHGADIQISAVGVKDTVVARFSRTRFEELLRSRKHTADTARLLERWIMNFTGSITQNTALRQFAPLNVNAPTELDPGEITRPVRNVVWVRALAGTARFMGHPELPLMTEDDFLPVSRDAWLQAYTQTTLYGLDTATFVQKAFAWTYISNYHHLVLNSVIWSMQREDEIEQERLSRRARYDRARFNTSFRQLASVLRRDDDLRYIAEAEDDPVLAACKVIGVALGVKVTTPLDPVDGRDEVRTLESVMYASGIRTREVRMRRDWWRRDNGPLLAYTEADSRPVALIPLSATSYELYDPVRQTRQRVDKRLAGTLSPQAISFYRTLPNRPLTGRDLLRFGLRDSWRDLRLVVLMGLIGGLIGVLVPLVTGRIFDVIVPSADRSQLVQFALILFATAFAAALFQVVRSIAILRVEIRLDSTLQSAVWDRLLHLPTPFFRNYTAGDLGVRAMGIYTIRRVVTGTVVLTLLSSIFSVFNFLLLFYFSVQLALLATVLVVVSVVVTFLAGYWQMQYRRRLADISGQLSGMVLQFITGISKLRVAGVEGRAFVLWAERFSRQKSLAFKAGNISNLLTVFNASYPIVASMALFAAVYDSLELSTGIFLAFFAAFTQFLFAGLELSTSLISVLDVVPAYERMQPIMLTVPEVDETKASPGELTGYIEVSRLSFRYHDDGPLILKDISFQVAPGDFVALVGPSGSGKSTLLRLLLGFERPASGGIFYDGQDLGGMDIRALRQQLGVVLQNSQLMTGDIYTNIVGAAPLTLEEAWEAARMAGLEEDIGQMPMGMHTVVSEGGSTLSGGQRQRLLIARAIAKRPKILFFDEATSALDNRTQAIVSQSLEKLDATRIVIAHRLSTIIHADHILVLENGSIVQQGRYDQLIRDDRGLFSQLARRQLI